MGAYELQVQTSKLEQRIQEAGVGHPAGNQKF